VCEVFPKSRAECGGAAVGICNTHLEGSELKSRSDSREFVLEYTWSFSVYPVNTGLLS